MYETVGEGVRREGSFEMSKDAGASVQPALERASLADDPDAMRLFISQGEAVFWTDLPARRALEAAKRSLTPSRVYHEIPTLEEIETGFETREAEPYAFDFLDYARMSDTLDALQPYAGEFDPPKTDPGAGFFWNDPAFFFNDAMTDYAFMRLQRPAAIPEVGGGYSILVAAEALKRNGGGRIVSIEPYPMARLASLPLERHELFVQAFDADFFNDTLADGDVLFIHSTPTVKMSSDCAHLYPCILPKIRRNILVHFHNVRWPRGLSARSATERHSYWTEQDLLAAHLTYNPKITFLLGHMTAFLHLKDKLRRLMGDKHPPGGGGIWFRLEGTKGL